MRILSFDTSTSALHVCLLENRTVVFEREVEPGPDRQQLASSLMPEVDKAFREMGWEKRSLEMVVVGVGPGSFTGVRVAVVTGRTLAQTLQLPLMGVSLLETYFRALSPAASNATLVGLPPAAIIVSTTSNNFFYGAFAGTPEDPAHPVMPSGFASADELRERLSNVVNRYSDEGAMGVFAAKPPQPLPLIKNIAATQAQLAYDRLSLKRLLPSDSEKNGKNRLAETFPWADVLPLYLRGPSVTIKKQKDYATPNPPNDRS